MKPLPQTNWIDHTFAVTIDGTEYSVRVNVYTETRTTEDPYSRGGKDEKVTASVEGWSSLPACEDEQHRHWKKLDEAVREEVEEKFQ